MRSPFLIGSLQPAWWLSTILLGLAMGCGGEEQTAAAAAGVGAGDGTGAGAEPGGSGGDPLGGAAGMGPGAGGGQSDLPRSCAETDCGVGQCDDVSGSVTCVCPAGFVDNGFTCVDVDECRTGFACGAEASCVNINGGAYCDCDDGFRPTEDTSCGDLDECAAHPCHEDAVCTNLRGSFACHCGAAAPYGDGLFCLAHDPCDGDPCGPHGTCVPTPSGHVCQCAPGEAGRESCAPVCSVIELADAELEDALRLALGKPTGDITAKDVAELEILDASHRPIADLSGLECLPSLRRLRLAYTALDADSVLSIIGQLNRLTHLDLSCTNIVDLDFLAQHPTLTALEVNHPADLCPPSQLVNVSGVTTARALTHLTLQGHGLTSLAGFENLKRLVALSVSQNQIHDLTPLLGIPGLQNLYVASNALTDLDVVGELTELRALDVSDNPLTNWSGLSALGRLEVLHLDSLGLEALPELGTATHLRLLSFSLNHISSLEPLAAIPSLNWVFAASNSITTVEPLVGTSFRGTLVMTSNPLDCALERPHQAALIAQGVSFFGTMCL